MRREPESVARAGGGALRVLVVLVMLVVLAVLVVAGSGWAGGDGRGREPTRENDISGVLPGTLPGLW